LKFGVIGYGSIGNRHVDNLIKNGIKDIVLLRKIGKGNAHQLIEHTDFDLFLSEGLDAIIISNPTYMHSNYLIQILKKDINVLVEKPLVAKQKELEHVKTLIDNYKGIGMTAYNMRFNPCVIETKKFLDSKLLGKIHYARFFVGQYLPDWRPNMNHLKSYSSERAMGGGVLLDLIHEIDLAFFLIDKPNYLAFSEIDKISNLTKDSEDIAEIVYKAKDQSIVSIHLDYLTRGYERFIKVYAENGNLVSSLSENYVKIFLSNSEPKIKYFKDFSRNDMYNNMLTSFIDCINKQIKPESSLLEGVSSNQFAIKLRDEYYEQN
tara:strand:- start:355 stop:1314 length:960 start_codon:yes stop_codon:yes gene_type:complete